jgi:hypothetical protein
MPRFVPILAPSVNVPVTPTVIVTWNPAAKDSRITLSNGDLAATMGANPDGQTSFVRADQVVLDKRYWEIVVETLTGQQANGAGISRNTVALRQVSSPPSGQLGGTNESVGWFSTGEVYMGGVALVAEGAASAYTAGDRLMFAYDGVTGRLWMGKNGAWLNGGNPSAGTGFIATLTNCFAALSIRTEGTAYTLAPAVFTYLAPTGFGAYNDATGSPGGGGVVGPGVPTEPLLWNPAVRVALDPNKLRIVNVPASTPGNTADYTVAVNAGEHIILRLPANEPRHGSVKVTGPGNTDTRLWIIGGQIKRYKKIPGTEGRMLHIHGIDHAYLEGLWLNGQHFVGSGIVNQANNSRSYRQWNQNLLITGIGYADSGQGDDPDLGGHGDLMISQSGLRKGAFWNRVSGWYWATGHIYTASSSWPGDATSELYTEGFKFIDCDFNAYNTQYNPKGGLYPGKAFHVQNNSQCFFLGGSSGPCFNFPLQFQRCYLWDDQTGTVSYTDVHPLGTTNTHSDTRKSLAFLAGFANCDSLSGDSFTGTLSRVGMSNTSGVMTGGRPPAPFQRGFVDAGELEYGLLSTGPTHAGCFTGLNYPQPNIPGFITGSGGHPGYQE